MNDSDTIAAIATSMSDAGIGIVRLSGKKAIACAERIVRNARGERDLTKREANTIRFSRIYTAGGEVLDEALVSVMRAPFSYTGEDMVEINVHGGHLVMEETLRLLLAAGRTLEGEGEVRLALPGEYTKRAFLSGKMDLTRAEAVQDLIASDNAFALQNAARQLGGALRERILSMRERLLHEAAFLEAALDDPDTFEEDLSTYGAHLKEVTGAVSGEIRALVDGFQEGVLRKDGLSCAIVGPVNAGKSSLLNALTGNNKAIVTDIPGTTRDVIEETVKKEDVLLHLADTAGIREANDPVEEEGIKRARKTAREAALTLIVCDAAADPGEEILSLLEMADSGRSCILLNKADLLTEKERESVRERWDSLLAREKKEEMPFLLISAKTGEGLEEVFSRILALAHLKENAPKQEFYLTNLRHREALSCALESLLRVDTAVDEGVSEDLYLMDLMDAYRSLSSVIGEEVSEDLIDRIFQDFCMGK